MFRWIVAVMLVGCTSSVTETPVDTDLDDHWDELPLREKCFEGVGDDSQNLPEYDEFGVVVPRHCSGTDHQDIADVQRVVFLGDSITTGTPPTPENDFYRNVLTRDLERKFGELQVDDCSAFGARTDDLLLEPHQQIHTCFPEPEPKTTLVVMTMGGNDAFAFAEDYRDGATDEAVLADVDHAADLMDDAVRWFRDNEADRFPGGVFVMFGNVYEYTDTEGDMASCPGAEFFGFEGTIPGMRDAYVRLNERFVQTAAETGTDVIFMLERFCGHGFHAGEEANECFRGADAQVWFDGTCIHPNPVGHEVIASMFMDVVNE